MLEPNYIIIITPLNFFNSILNSKIIYNKIDYTRNFLKIQHFFIFIFIYFWVWGGENFPLLEWPFELFHQELHIFEALHPLRSKYSPQPFLAFHFFFIFGFSFFASLQFGVMVVV